MINLFNDLINEHGSSNILKERIALIRDQYAILDKENTSLKAENKILKTENADLNFKNQNLAEKITVYEKPAKKMPKFTFNPGVPPPRNMI